MMSAGAEVSPEVVARRADMLRAIVSGLLLAWTFPPADWKWLAWVALVPLLVAVRRCESPRRAFVLGWVVGAIFFVITLHPLVSVHSWTGWIRETGAERVARLTRQWVFMHVVWLVFSAVFPVFWGAWAALVKVWGRTPWRRAAVAVGGWVLLPEWARALASFGFEWNFLGLACADWPALRQAAALGGVPLLSALVVFVNGGVAEAWPAQHRRSGWPVLAAGLACVGVLALWGQGRLARLRPGGGSLSVAVVQYSQAKYTAQDYSELGLIRGYWQRAQEAMREPPRWLVLPESVVKGTISLDGTPSPTKPPEKTYPHAQWALWMRQLLAAGGIAVVGSDTVQAGHDHNTMLVWSAEDLLGWYNKRQLVPFSEYQPWLWGGWALRGPVQYTAGQGAQNVTIQGVPVGFAVCQEILYGALLRASVRAGAQVLVSGGNDGVFEHPAIAQAQADAAQLRAVETGRDLVRAMKSGFSAVIDATGRETARSEWRQDIVLRAAVTPRTDLTPAMRFGPWVLWVAAGLVVLAAVGKKVPGTSWRKGARFHRS